MVTIIVGINTNNGLHVPFTFVANNTYFTNESGNFEIRAKCWAGQLGSQKLEKISGEISVKGTLKEAQFLMTASAENPKAIYHITTKGEHMPRSYFSPPEAARRAAFLIGEKAEKYLAVNVINYAIWGFPYVKYVNSCKWFLEKLQTVAATKPGFIVVGKDGKHCGIVDKEGDNFIHSNPVKKHVTSNPLTMLKEYFPDGYVIKGY